MKSLLLLLPLTIACIGSDKDEDSAPLDADADTDADADADADADTDTGPGCDSTHAMNGWVAEFPEGLHDTSGTATIIDDCTIEVTHFNFDGEGIEVRFYGGMDDVYATGFSISEDLFGTVHTDETHTLILPDDKTLDDMNGISVWCVAFGLSFTAARFEAP